MSEDMTTILDEKGLLESIPALKPRLLGRLRRAGRIPHLRLSERSILYDLDRVTEALRKLEVSK
jgi:hypothetical protein